MIAMLVILLFVPVIFLEGLILNYVKQKYGKRSKAFVGMAICSTVLTLLMILVVILVVLL